MNERPQTAERLAWAEARVAWVRVELDREITDLVAQVACAWGTSWTAATYRAGIGNQLVSERIAPLLAQLDSVQAQVAYAQLELVEPAP